MREEISVKDLIRPIIDKFREDTLKAWRKELKIALKASGVHWEVLDEKVEEKIQQRIDQLREELDRGKYGL